MKVLCLIFDSLVTYVIKDYPGITFLTMQEIYNKIESLENKSCEIGISYLEVYNETVKDLLAPGALLDIRESGTATMIPGLSIHKPSGPDSILSLLSFGNGNRTQHATDANSESSRSHAVLQVTLHLILWLCLFSCIVRTQMIT